MRGRGKAAVLLGCVALMGGLVGACGDDSDSGGGGGSTSSDSGGESANAKVIDPASMDGAKGEITYCQGKDTAGNAKALIEGFNQKFQSQGITAKLVEFPADAGQQRAQFVQRQEAKSGECDVFSSDVIWTAEFASQGWIYDMTPYVESKKSDFIPAVLETATYNDKIWAVPNTSDAAFIYYHTDKVKEIPQTWQDVYSEAGQKGGIVYQGAAYEGLTCDFLEIAFAAGGSVISEDGKQVDVQLARERQGAPVHDGRHQERRRAEGRRHVHGGGVAARLRGGPCRLHAQLAVRLRRSARRTRTPRSSTSRRSRRSRAAARPASSAATTT